MSFAWEPRHFPTLDLFRQYLKTLTKPTWVAGTTIHHTWKPTPATWHGMASMESLGVFYRDIKDWPAGPHLFLCVGAPSPSHDGIFIGTPLDTPGVHAGVCNSTRWGMEVVGNFDAIGWSPRLSDLVYGTNQALADFGRFPPETVNGHRECNSPKTCPGLAINLSTVRAEAKRRAMPDYVALWGDAAPYHASWGIPQRYRTEYEAGRPLGKVVSAELPMLDGRVYQIFETGLIAWSPVDIKVWR